MEALLRWKHPERGIILQDEFIPLAEEVGLIVPLGEWVLRHRSVHGTGSGRRTALLRVSVIISWQQLQQNFIETMAKALEAGGLEPGYLMLEITESIVIQHSTEVMNIFNELSGKGVRFSMDAFGTGYSSAAATSEADQTNSNPISLNVFHSLELRKDLKEEENCFS